MEVTDWQTGELFLFDFQISPKEKLNESFILFQQRIETAAAMGAHLVRRYITETDTEPDPARKFEFDPLYGFPERKERGLSLTISRRKRQLKCDFCMTRIASRLVRIVS